MSKRPAEDQLTKEIAAAADNENGSAEPAFTVYGENLSTSTQRVLLTAAELGVAYDYRILNCITGSDTKTAEYLAINPFGRVPAAVIDGVTMYESRAIARMLADKYQSKGSELMPTDFKRRAVFEQWASLEVTTFSPKVDLINAERVWYPMFGIPGNEQKAQDTYTAYLPHLTILNNQLSTHHYITGHDLSLVDLFLLPDFTHLAGTVEGKELLKSFPHIAAWWTRMTARPSWHKLHPLIKGDKAE